LLVLLTTSVAEQFGRIEPFESDLQFFHQHGGRVLFLVCSDSSEFPEPKSFQAMCSYSLWWYPRIPKLVAIGRGSALTLRLTSFKLWSISSSIMPGAGLSEDEDAVTLAGSSNLLMIERVALGFIPRSHL
jgi:hypothetical protein